MGPAWTVSLIVYAGYLLPLASIIWAEVRSTKKHECLRLKFIFVRGDFEGRNGVFGYTRHGWCADTCSSNAWDDFPNKGQLCGVRDKNKPSCHSMKYESPPLAACCTICRSTTRDWGCSQSESVSVNICLSWENCSCVCKPQGIDMMS